jgi:hypothetical protein
MCDVAFQYCARNTEREMPCAYTSTGLVVIARRRKIRADSEGRKGRG